MATTLPLSRRRGRSTVLALLTVVALAVAAFAFTCALTVGTTGPDAATIGPTRGPAAPVPSITAPADRPELPALQTP